MKKSLLPLALSLLALGAQADEHDQVTYEFSNPSHSFPVRSITAEVGIATPVQVGDAPTTGKCEFNKKLFEASFASTVELRSGGSTALMVMPIVSDEKGVKTLVTIRSEKVVSTEWVDITADCKLPLGKSQVSNSSFVKVFNWGEQYDIELADAKVVTITAKKAL